jgi:hypothetical protein
MFENYLGIAQRKEQVAADIKNLSASQTERRRARRLQSRKMLMQAVSRSQMKTLDHAVQILKKTYFDDGYDPAEVEKATPYITSLAVVLPLLDPDFQMLFRRYTQTCRARPDVKRFIHDWLDRGTEHAERVKALARTRKRRSRLKQSAKPEDCRVQVDLGARDSIKKLNA